MFVGLRSYQTLPPSSPIAHPIPGSHTELLSVSATTISYSVPMASYSIRLVVAHPCWVVVRSPKDNAAPLVARTILPSSKPFAIAVTGSSSITIAAQAESIAVIAGSRRLDTIVLPRLSVAYTFVSRS
jgi:hypothetical protein